MGSVEVEPTPEPQLTLHVWWAQEAFAATSALGATTVLLACIEERETETRDSWNGEVGEVVSRFVFLPALHRRSAPGNLQGGGAEVSANVLPS